MSDRRDKLIEKQASEIYALRERLGESEERIRQLVEEIRSPKRAPALWKLTPAEERVFVALAVRGFVAHETGNIIARLNPNAFDQKLLAIRVSGIRKKLREAGVDAEIQTVWGRGFALVDNKKWEGVLQ